MANSSELTVLVKKSDGTFERVPLSELAKRPKAASVKSVEPAVTKPMAVVSSAASTPVIPAPAAIQTPVVNSALRDSSSARASLGMTVKSDAVKMTANKTEIPNRACPVPRYGVRDDSKKIIGMTATDTKSLLEDDDSLSIASPAGAAIPNRRENQVETVLKKLSFSVPPNFDNRLRSLILLRLKEVRGEVETRATALRSIKDGGLGLTEPQALQLEEVCVATGNLKKMSSHSATPNSSGELKKWDTRPVLATINSAFNLPAVSTPHNAFVHPASTTTVVASAPAPTPAPAPRFEISSVVSARPTMADVTAETITVGPLEEIKSLTLEDFRRLSPESEQAAKRLAQKFLNLKEESVILFWQAQSAWRASALYLSYVSALAKDLLGAHYGAAAGVTLAFKPAELSALITMEKDLGI